MSAMLACPDSHFNVVHLAIFHDYLIWPWSLISCMRDEVAQEDGRDVFCLRKVSGNLYTL